MYRYCLSSSTIDFHTHTFIIRVVERDFDSLFSQCLASGKRSGEDFEIAFVETQIETDRGVEIGQKAVAIVHNQGGTATVHRMHASFVSPIN